MSCQGQESEGTKAKDSDRPAVEHTAEALHRPPSPGSDVSWRGLRITYWRSLLFVVLTAHLYALVAYGATFWIDSGGYSCLGLALLSPEKLAKFYDAAGVLMYGHYGLGLPVVWSVLSLLPAPCRWPLLALLQHGVAASSSLLAFATAHRIWPSWFHLAGAALLSLLPLYESMHNALMTESLTASVVLFGIALALRIIFLPHDRSRSFIYLLLAVALSVQFRTYCGPMLAAAAAVALWQTRAASTWRSWAALVAAVALSSAVLPVYRGVFCGRWFPPSIGSSRIVFAVWTNSSPSARAMKQLRALDWLPKETLRTMFDKSFEYRGAIAIGKQWLDQGVSLSEVSRRIQTISSLIEGDQRHILAIKLRCGFAASGWPYLAFLGPEEYRCQFATLAEERASKAAHLRYLSWISMPSYRADGVAYFLKIRSPLSNSREGQHALWDALAPYVVSWATAWRNPLALGDVPVDVWSSLGLIGMLVCLARCWPVGVILLIPVALNIAVTASLSLPGPRYCYTLLPLDCLAVGIACAIAFKPSSTRTANPLPPGQPC